MTTIPGAPGPGPSKYDKVFVTKFGPKSAKRVLVLMPGYYGGAGDFTLDAREIVKRVPGLQVWALDRRSQALEDTRASPTRSPGASASSRPSTTTSAGSRTRRSSRTSSRSIRRSSRFAKQWGLSLALQDVRRVVLSAKRQGKRVILGGHSLGASMTVAYASWDFDGQPGYKDLDGLVLIDGGLLGLVLDARPRGDEEGDQGARHRTGRSSTSSGSTSRGRPASSARSARCAVLKEPTAPAIAQSFPLLPAQFKPPIPATNRGLFGYAFDASTSPAALALIHVQAGTLGPNGDWVDGEVTPIERLAQTFGQEPANASEWYFPAKLSIDVDAANALTRNAQTDYLKLRPWHRRAVDLPLYALQTDLTHGRVLRGAKRFIAGSKVPRGALGARRRIGHREPPGPADRRARSQPFPADGCPVPAQAGTIDAMSERTSYEPGVPSWADLTSPDVEASKRFYSGLFGWDAQDAGPAEETGGYAMFTLRGRNVAGLSASAGREPASDVVDLRRHRRRRRRGGARHRGRRQRPLRAYGRHGRGAHGRVRPSGRRHARRLAGGPPHGRRAGQRARRDQLERAADARRRGRQGVLRGRLRLGSPPTRTSAG